MQHAPFRLVAIAIALVVITGACEPPVGDRPPADDAVGQAPVETVQAPDFGGLPGPFLMNLDDGGEMTPLEGMPGGLSYVPSPDGSKVVYHTCCSSADVMKVVNIDGSDPRVVEGPDGLPGYGARWAPDGSQLVYQARDPSKDTQTTGAVGDLYVHDLASDERTRITDLVLEDAWWWFLAPSFAPDGRSVIFHLPRGASANTKWDVWSVPVTGGGPQRLIADAAFPRYLPDGKTIAFVVPAANNFEGFSIAMTDARGGRREELVSSRRRPIWAPSVSPDGSNIAYQVDEGSVYLLDVVTSETTRLTDGAIPEWVDDDTLLIGRP